MVKYAVHYFLIILPLVPFIFVNRLINDHQCVGAVNAISSTYGKKSLQSSFIWR